MILAGDIGGTKTNLAIFDGSAEAPVRVRSASLRSADFGGLAAALRHFLDSDIDNIRAAAFGIAGPVARNRTRTPNLTWEEVDGDALSRELRLGPVALLNDLVATALGVPLLSEAERFVLQAGEADPDATLAVIAAGTGLGMSALLPSPAGPAPMPSEGGHLSFAPRDAREQRLLLSMQRRVGGRVSVERVVSGPGIWAIYQFLRDEEGMPEDSEVRDALGAISPERLPEAAAGVISASRGRCPLCYQTLDLFVSAYGAIAGDLALITLSRAGLCVAGGVAARNPSLMQSGTFMAAFLDKGRYRPILERVPVWVATDQDLPLLGAARWAFNL